MVSDEKWIAVRYDVLFPDGDRFRGIQGGPTGEQRAKLASFAPEMANMLLLLAGGDGDPYCQGCGPLEHVRQHKPDCDLWRLLVEAGVVKGASILKLVEP